MTQADRGRDAFDGRGPLSLPQAEETTNAAGNETAEPGTTHLGRSVPVTRGPESHDWLDTAVDATPGAGRARNQARPALGWIASGGTGVVAAAGMVLGSFLFTPASSAQVTGAGSSRTGGPRATVEWAGFAGNAQHTAVARERPQPFRRIRWRAKVDLAPHLVDGELLIHYGSPMITAANTVLVPTRVSARAGFRVVAYSGTMASGAGRLTPITGRLRSPMVLAPLRRRCPLS